MALIESNLPDIQLCLLFVCYFSDVIVIVHMQAGQKVIDVYEDFKDGSKLLLLLELLTGDKLVSPRNKRAEALSH